MIWYYIITFALSLICSSIYLGRYHRHYDVQFTLVYILVPIVMMGYLALALAHNLEEAVLANKIVYLGGCFTLTIITLYIMSMCRITITQTMMVLINILNLIFYRANRIHSKTQRRFRTGRDLRSGFLQGQEIAGERQPKASQAR